MFLSSWLCANQNHLNCTARRRTGRRPVVAQQLHRWEGHSVTRCEAVTAHNNLIRIRQVPFAGLMRIEKFFPGDPGAPAAPAGQAPAGPAGPVTPVSPLSPLSPLYPLGPSKRCKRECSNTCNYRNCDTHNLLPHLSLNYFRLARDVPFIL
jgi:hypothetical protein